jgi:SAM-dependent methyltransferase
MSDVFMPPEAAAMPDPGDDLIARVVGGPDHTWFFWTGRESVRELERTLAIAGRSLDSFESILDFGCGCGRMLLWMEEQGRRSALHGTDIDAEAIAWCREHVPYATVTVNDADPPLPYPDGAFDLVFNHSVFTHVNERRQDAWLSELQRVTRPGGLLVLSTHGEVALGQDYWGIRDRLEREGIVFIDNLFPPDFPLPKWYQNTYHAPWYVFEHWGRWFEIRGYVPGGALGVQDHVLLERRADDAPASRPLAARPPLAAPTTPGAVALAAARADRDAAATASSRFGVPGQIVRRAALRAMRPYSAHEDRFDATIAAAIAEIAEATREQAARLEALERRVDDGA